MLVQTVSILAKKHIFLNKFPVLCDKFLITFETEKLKKKKITINLGIFFIKN